LSFQEFTYLTQLYIYKLQKYFLASPRISQKIDFLTEKGSTYWNWLVCTCRSKSTQKHFYLKCVVTQSLLCKRNIYDFHNVLQW